jgi:hypothetical protein
MTTAAALEINIAENQYLPYQKKIKIKIKPKKTSEGDDNGRRGTEDILATGSLLLASTASTQHIVHCPESVVAGHLITKDKRHEIHGIVAGGAGSRKPEDLQIQQIIQGTGQPCPKTRGMRINLRTKTLHRISQPNKNKDGFDYTEDFDGVQTIDGKQIYINLKCIVGKGGSQTRSLREVNWFVEGQMNVVKNSGKTNVFFANILDGDEAHAVLPKFEYLLSLPEFITEKNNIYVGDLKGYFEWVKRTFFGE